MSAGVSCFASAYTPPVPIPRPSTAPASADAKPLARRIFLRTLEAVDPSAAVERCLSRASNTLGCSGSDYDLGQFPDLRVLAVGKAAHGMLAGLVRILPSKTKISGVVSAPTPSPAAPLVSGVPHSRD